MKKDNKKEKEPFVKTRVRRDKTIEVELKNPSKTLLGKVFIYIIIFGMTLLSLFSLIYLIIEVANK